MLKLFIHPELWRLNLGIFNLHAILTACFVVLPIMVSHLLKQQHSWMLYFFTLLISCTFTFPLLSYAEKKQRLKQIFIGAIACLMVTLLWLWFFHNNLYEISVGLIAFFTAFNYLEANLPSLISRAAPVDRKGTAIGIYSSSQFLGIFCGGLLGGWVYGHFSPATIFIICSIIAGLWCLAAYSMSDYVNMTNQTRPVNSIDEQQSAELPRG
jgi:predicted MFS family arabinose efflux permease